MNKQCKLLHTLFTVSLFLLISCIHLSSFCQKPSSSTSDSTSYLKLIREIKMKQHYMTASYNQAEDPDKVLYIEKTEQLLIHTLYKQIIPRWIGTKWEFYGETQVPGDSSIACGHFVVTTLKHLGMIIEDSHEMATNYSAYMVNSLCDTSYKVYKAADMIEIVKHKPNDVWVVGLRNHSGFIIKDGDSIRFVHSSYSTPDAVVNEPIETSMIFQGSGIFVAGNLFVKNGLTKKWLNEELVKYTKKY